jgi:hypothetical protein
MKKAVCWRYEYIFAYYDRVSQSNKVYRIYLNTVQHISYFIISTMYVVLTGAGIAQSLQ